MSGSGVAFTDSVTFKSGRVYACGGKGGYGECGEDGAAFVSEVTIDAQDHKMTGGQYENANAAVTEAIGYFYVAIIEIPPPTAYTITWNNDDGTEIGTSTVNEGVTPEFSDTIGTIKKKPEDDTYTFLGWTGVAGLLLLHTVLYFRQGQRFLQLLRQGPAQPQR